MRDVLIAGDTLDFVTSVPAYPASAGYTLKYRLIPRFAVTGTPIIFTAATSGTDDYRVTVAPVVTATWVAGEYTWSAWVEKADERHVVDNGLCTLRPDPSFATDYDGRSMAQKALDDAKTALATFQATGGRVKSYAIGGRSMEFDSAGDILVLVSYWQIQVTRENQAAAVAKGLPDPRRILVRFGGRA
jgi:hypothetical protein